MKHAIRRLALSQMDEKYRDAEPTVIFSHDLKGRWVLAIRELLRMSQRQLGKRLGASTQSISQFEKSEQNGSISIKSMEKLAEGLDMQFYYGFYPRPHSMEKIIQKQALKLASEIVQRTAISMKLEDQGLSKQKLEEAIIERAEELYKEMPRYLWD